MNNKRQKIIAIHQPNYFPWLGFFYKLWASDAFVFLDHVQFSKQSYTQSVLTRRNNSTIDIIKHTVPVTKAPLDTSINRIKIDGKRWIRKHEKHINQVYAKSQHFKQISPLYNKLMADCHSIDHLSDLNIYMISMISKLLQIDTPTYLSSNMNLNKKSTDLLISIIKELEGNIYLSGKGADKYQDNALFIEHDISIQCNNFYGYLEENPYICQETKFINGLSILDALFHIGPKGIITLFMQYKDLNFNINVHKY